MASSTHKGRIRNVEIDVIKEDDGSYAIACSSLGVYAVGKTLAAAKKDFSEALDLHLDVIRDKALKTLAQKASV